MNQHITDLLKEHFGLGSDSRLLKGFREGTLELPFTQNKKLHLRPNADYQPPTPYDFAHFKKVTSLSTGAVARRFSIDSRRMNSMISQRQFEKNKDNRLPTTVWCAALEAANLSSRLILKPRFADIRDDVLETSQILPNRHEFFLILCLYGQPFEKVAEDTGIDINVIQTNARRGIVPHYHSSEELSSMLNLNENEVPTLHGNVVTTPVDFGLDEWSVLRKYIGCTSSTFITTPPIIRAATVSQERKDFSPYKKDRVRIAKEKQSSVDDVSDSEEVDEIRNIREFYSEILEGVKPEESKYVKLTTDNDQPYYAISLQEYEPPTSYELRQVVNWTGFSIQEIATLLSMRPKELSYLMSPKAMEDYSKLKSGDVEKKKERTRMGGHFIEFHRWRRLLEVFNLSHQKKIRRVGEDEF